MISGTMIVRDCIRHDYCLEASLRSLIHVTDEVVVVDVGSTDQTVELIKSISTAIKIIETPFDSDRYKSAWLYRAGELARDHINGNFHVCLEADEVLHESSRDIFRELERENNPRASVICEFWRNRRSCFRMNKTTRSAPRRFCFSPFRWGPLVHPQSGEEIGDVDLRIPIYHYGFIRRWEQWREKGRLLQTSLHGVFDSVWDNATPEAAWALRDNENIEEFKGAHPKWIAQWLEEHPENA